MEELEMKDLVSLAKKAFPDIEKTFYGDFREYLERLAREAEEGDDEAMKNMDKARQYGERIYRRRMKGLFSNVVKKLATPSAKINLSEYTPEEVEIYHAVMELLEMRKLALLEGKMDLIQDSAAPSGKQDESHDSGRDSGEEPVEKKEPAREKTAVARDVLVTVRATDSAEFAGLGGHNYVLKKGDVVNMERSFADLLIKIKKAEKVEPRW